MPMGTFADPAMMRDTGLYSTGTEGTSDIDKVAGKQLQATQLSGGDKVRLIAIKNQRISSGSCFHGDMKTKGPSKTGPIGLDVVLAIMTPARALFLSDNTFNCFRAIKLLTHITWIQRHQVHATIDHP